MKRKFSPPDDVVPRRRQRVADLSTAQVQLSTMEIEDPDTVTKLIDDKNSTYNCKVYWGKNMYDVEIDQKEGLFALKMQLFEFTQVDPERQKIVINKRLMKDEEFNNITLKDGLKIAMIGSNDVITMPIVLDDDKLTKKTAPKLPPFGIKNYGNTCYMNSVLQLIRYLPEMKEAIINNETKSDENPSNLNERNVIKSMAQLYKALDQRSNGYEQFMKQFIDNIERIHPEYTMSIEKGGRPQQDANEFFVRVVNILKKNLNYQVNQFIKGRDVVETMFGIDMVKTFKCLEKDGDSTKSINEKELQLSCFITSSTRFMLDGIRSKLNEVITKRSDLLERDANFSVNTAFSRLPAYLCVQFVRFFYKEEEKVNAKIMKDVKFPLRFDINELCTPTLREKFKLMQTQVIEFENKLSMAETEASRKLLFKKQEAGFISLPDQKLGAGDSGCGIYNLIGVLTHKGRSTTSGHYISWVKLDDKKWAKLDDDTCSFATESDILKLSGGGVNHTAYLLIYQTIKVPK